MTHMPVYPHPDFKGKTGNGDFADVLAQIDAYVGMLMESVKELGIEENTIFIFTSDNGPDPTTPHTSFAGPWSGSYFTGKEGSLRVPFIIRWPGNIPAGSSNNEIVHENQETVAGEVNALMGQDQELWLNLAGDFRQLDGPVLAHGKRCSLRRLDTGQSVLTRCRDRARRVGLPVQHGHRRRICRPGG